MKKQQLMEQYSEIHNQLRKILPQHQRALLDQLKEVYDEIIDNDEQELQ